MALTAPFFMWGPENSAARICIATGSAHRQAAFGELNDDVFWVTSDKDINIHIPTNEALAKAKLSADWAKTPRPAVEYATELSARKLATAYRVSKPQVRQSSFPDESWDGASHLMPETDNQIPDFRFLAVEDTIQLLLPKQFNLFKDHRPIREITTFLEQPNEAEMLKMIMEQRGQDVGILTVMSMLDMERSNGTIDPMSHLWVVSQAHVRDDFTDADVANWLSNKKNAALSEKVAGGIPLAVGLRFYDEDEPLISGAIDPDTDDLIPIMRLDQLGQANISMLWQCVYGTFPLVVAMLVKKLNATKA